MIGLVFMWIWCIVVYIGLICDGIFIVRLIFLVVFCVVFFWIFVKVRWVGFVVSRERDVFFCVVF